mmetsp:Transcript_7391/g.16132  ORF Transcript_7391/g.16132 Transcript_7391/m.16132 type:complete len:111 (-) Transcript_7391:146-478(-)|eukprot:CAMPEP_0170615046 /NCGR_PEP_ID=MMETSP0224-20130122/25125_1 /TAXON_ID=285029 /ORGANISM="Togula jolla, Strain CCCM 725" /LENGTH=110 /DNA_ID=CAMNT_0010940745 /DNA_START=66 /DNA_END=398 /DNA_ORIENTATION=+
MELIRKFWAKPIEKATAWDADEATCPVPVPEASPGSARDYLQKAASSPLGQAAKFFCKEAVKRRWSILWAMLVACSVIAVVVVFFPNVSSDPWARSDSNATFATRSETWP